MEIEEAHGFPWKKEEEKQQIWENESASRSSELVWTDSATFEKAQEVKSETLERARVYSI